MNYNYWGQHPPATGTNQAQSYPQGYNMQPARTPYDLPQPQPYPQAQHHPEHISIPPYHGYPSYVNALPPTPTQQQPHQMIPRSPASSETASITPQEEEDAVRRQCPPPAPLSRTRHGTRYELNMFQEPSRARMCGQGDKDRRPISAPPIVQARLYDSHTGHEIDYNGIDAQHLICTASLYNRDGDTDVMLNTQGVGHSYASSRSYSTSTAAVPQSPGAPSPYNQFPPNGYQSGPYGHSSRMHSTDNSMFPQAHGPPPFNPSTLNSRQLPAPHGLHQANTIRPQPPPTPPAPETPGISINRNLIGATVATAQKLTPLGEKEGLFFIFADMSVRSDDWFRLKFSLFNIGQSLGHMDNDALFKKADSINAGAFRDPEIDLTESKRQKQDKDLQGIRMGMVADSAPCLATVFSVCFKVYSAKKFPGVATSMNVGELFKGQGVRIAMRKGEGEGGKGKKRSRREIEDEGEDEEDDEE